MEKEYGVSEIIGAIALMGIIVAAFGIFSAIYLPTIKPNPIPQVKLSMACSDNTTVNDGFDIDFPCIQGSFSCHPSETFNNRTCEEDCKYRDYSMNPQYDPENYQREMYRCMENCMRPLCSDLGQCRTIYICHNGGDTLNLNNLNILVNSEIIPISEWSIKQPMVSDNFSQIPMSIPENMEFGIGASLRKQRANPSTPVDTIMIIYNLPSGGNFTLALNQFGTDINQ